MAFDTVRSNKMRSGLTVLGVVIGITSIVGMTAMIRGFDESLRDAIRTIGPKVMTLQRAGPLSFANGVQVRRDHEAAQPDDLGRARDRGGSDDDSGRGYPARDPGHGAADAGARVLSKPADSTAVDARHDRELRCRDLARADARPLLQRHRSAVPKERGRPRTDALSGALRA